MIINKSVSYSILLATSLILCGFQLRAQNAVNGFFQLSRPEKCWTIAHPFVAKKAWVCTQQARAATDSLEKNGTLTDPDGGQLDAFRHAYWMALLVQKMSAKKAEKLGIAHEKGNYIQFKKGQLEEKARPDSLASEMDLKNNRAGIEAGLKYKADTSLSKGSLVETILFLDWEGQLTITKKDSSGQYLTCEGKVIDLSVYTGIWSVPKCLVPSNNVAVEH
jgi:hypothetical protein